MSLSVSLGRRGLLLRCICHHTLYLSEKRSLSRALYLGKNLILNRGASRQKDTCTGFWFSASPAEANLSEIHFQVRVGVNGDCFRSAGFVPVSAGR